MQRKHPYFLPNLFQYWKVEVLKQLLQFIVKNNLPLIDSQNDFGFTALHWASIRGRLQSLKILIEFGADITVLDNENKTDQDGH